MISHLKNPAPMLGFLFSLQPPLRKNFCFKIHIELHIFELDGGIRVLFEIVFDDHGGGVLPTIVKSFDVFHLPTFE